jgi:hypothetical protein
VLAAVRGTNDPIPRLIQNPTPRPGHSAGHHQSPTWPES